MKILHNYILNEFFVNLFICLLILTLVMLLGNMVQLANLIINKGVGFWTVTKLFLYLIPYLLTYTIPIAALMGIFLTLGRWSADNEIIAIRSSGINIFGLVLPLIILGLILSLLLVILNDRIIPQVRYASRKALVDIGIKNPAAALEAGTFINSFQNYILFIYNIEGNKLSHVRIYEPINKQEGRTTARTIVAKHGEFICYPEKNIVKLKLMDGMSDEPDLKNPNNFYKLNFKTYFLTLSLNQELEGKNIPNKKPKDMTIRELESQIQKLKNSGINPAPLVTEIHKKISLAFSCFVFILIGCPLSLITHRREKTINFGLSLLVVMVYYLLLLGSEALSLQLYLPPHLAMWLPNILLGLPGVLFTYKLCVS